MAAAGVSQHAKQSTVVSMSVCPIDCDTSPKTTLLWLSDKRMLTMKNVSNRNKVGRHKMNFVSSTMQTSIGP